MNKIVHVEISAEDPERAIKFYSDVFGWEFKKMEMEEPPEEVKKKMMETMPEMKPEDMDYWTFKTGNSDLGGGLSRRSKPLGEGGFNAFVCSIEVDDVESFQKKVESAGGKVTVPKMPIPGEGWWATFEDTEKNVVGLFTPDKQASW